MIWVKASWNQHSNTRNPFVHGSRMSSPQQEGHCVLQHLGISVHTDWTFHCWQQLMNEDKMGQDGADLNNDCNPFIAIMKRKTLGSLESIPSTVGVSFQHILTECNIYKAFWVKRFYRPTRWNTCFQLTKWNVQLIWKTVWLLPYDCRFFCCFRKRYMMRRFQIGKAMAKTSGNLTAG